MLPAPPAASCLPPAAYDFSWNYSAARIITLFGLACSRDTLTHLDLFGGVPLTLFLLPRVRAPKFRN
jgi:hypothetical protein